MRRLARAGAALCTVAAALFAACSADAHERTADAGDAPLLVFAAASLSRALPELAARFEAETGTRVEPVLGATGTLAAQIEHGAPADVFLAADEASVRRLASAGVLRPASVRDYATGRLVVVWRDGVAAPASLEALAEPRFGVVAIANPEHAPYGVAAREALVRLGLWAALEPRIVRAEGVLQAYQLVRSGNADAAIVAQSVVADAAAGGESLPVDPALHAPVRHAAGVVSESGHPAAEAFLDFVASAAGQGVLARHGFGPAGAP
jgi:molybdate transport system substrate-binding protein